MNLLVDKKYIDPKKITHYYVDGGVKEDMSVAAFIKKGYAQKTVSHSRKYQHPMKSSEAEIRAIKIAMKDAKEAGLDPKTVVIHTDQKPLFNHYLSANDALAALKEEIDSDGFHIKLLKSKHSQFGQMDKSQQNALAVHLEVTQGFNKKPNRYRVHLNKKKSSK